MAEDLAEDFFDALGVFLPFVALPLDPLGICKLTDKIQTKKYFCGQSMNSNKKNKQSEM
jgi:hypothetical protein